MRTKLKTIVLRVVGGPHDGATVDVAENAASIMLSEGTRMSMGGVTFSERINKKTATLYTRRAMHFEDGQTVHFLCWVKYTDRQAMCHLLRIPYEEASNGKAAAH